MIAEHVRYWRKIEAMSEKEIRFQEELKRVITTTSLAVRDGLHPGCRGIEGCAECCVFEAWKPSQQQPLWLHMTQFLILLEVFLDLYRSLLPRFGPNAP